MFEYILYDDSVCALTRFDRQDLSFQSHMVLNTFLVFSELFL